MEVEVARKAASELRRLLDGIMGPIENQEVSHLQRVLQTAVFPDERENYIMEFDGQVIYQFYHAAKV